MKHVNFMFVLIIALSSCDTSVNSLDDHRSYDIFYNKLVSRCKEPCGMSYNVKPTFKNGQLVELAFTSISVDSIPFEINKFKNLEKISLLDVNIKSIKNIYISSIKFFYASHTNMNYISDIMLSFPNMVNISVERSGIRGEINANVFNKSITRASFSRNYITHINYKENENIKNIDVSFNKIKSPRDIVVGCNTRCVLDVTNNLFPPKELINTYPCLYNKIIFNKEFID